MARLQTPVATFVAFVASRITMIAAGRLPTPIFTSKLTGLSHGPGTAAKVSPDRKHIYVTANDGSLVIADTTTGAVLHTKKPALAVGCNTGVSFSPDGKEVVYAVWTDSIGSVSQINAYSTATNNLTWSYDVRGNIAGAPMYSKGGDKIYFTWNDLEGHFSVLAISGNNAIEEFSASLSDIDVGPPKGVNTELITSELTWSGVDVTHDPMRVENIEDDDGNPTGEYEIVPGGNYQYGKGNTNDLVVWAHLSPSNARTNQAYYYIYQPPMLPTDPHEIIALDSVGWAVLRRPVLSSNGIRTAVAGQRGISRGWTEPAPLSQGANIKLNIKQNQRNGPNPSQSTPSFTPDNKFMFFASTQNAVYGVTADEPSPEDTDMTPAYLWETITDSVVTAGTQPSEDSSFVYVLTSGGFAHKLDVETGADEWQTASVRASGGVLAEFSVTGGKMFFVTSNGYLNGWTVGEAVVPPKPETDAPTFAPTAMPVEPTESPLAPPETETDAPVSASTTMPVEETDAPISAPTTMPVKAAKNPPLLVVVIIFGVLVIFLLVCIIVLVIRRTGGKPATAPTEKSNIDASGLRSPKSKIHIGSWRTSEETQPVTTSTATTLVAAMGVPLQEDLGNTCVL